MDLWDWHDELASPMPYEVILLNDLVRLFGGDIPEGEMEPLTIVVSFDVREQVVTGGIPAWVASLVHEFGFQSAEAAFHWCVVPAISLPAHGLDHPVASKTGGF
jgi:hypothetical protein